MPRRLMRVPPTFRAIELIGATVVAMFRKPLAVAKESVQPSDDAGGAGLAGWAAIDDPGTNPAARMGMPRTERRVVFTCMGSVPLASGSVPLDSTPGRTRLHRATGPPARSGS